MLADLIKTKKGQFISAVSIIGSIATIYTAVIFIDERFVHAADFAAQVEKQEQVLRDFRAQQLEDKVFELDFKIQSGVDTPLDRALKERYLQQLQRLDRR